MRTGNLIAAVMTATVLYAGGAFAQSSDVQAGVQIVIESPKIADRQAVQNMIAELKAAGFTYIEIHRTFLGRARLVAYSATEIREVILNPTTGEVLRDLAQKNTGDVLGDTSIQIDTVSQNSQNSNNGNKGGNGNGNGNSNGNNGNAGGGNRN